MAQLPSFEALGERPTPVLPRRTPMIAQYRATSGFEGVPSQELARDSGEMESAARLAMQVKGDHDRIRAEEKFVALRRAQIDLTTGPKGFANLKGGDAVNQPLLSQYGSQFDEVAATIAGTLDNDAQKSIFQRRAQIAGLQLREDIGRHVAHQTNIYDDDVFKSRIDTEIQSAAARWSTPDAASVPLLNIDNAIVDYAARRGKPDVWVKDARRTAQSAVITGMVRQAITSNPVAARQLFEAYGDMLQSNEKATLDHQTKQAVMPIEARGIVDALVPPTTSAKDTWSLYGGLKEKAEAEAARLHPGDQAFKNATDKELKAKIADLALQQRGVQNKALQDGMAVVHGLDQEGKPLAKPTSMAQAMKDPRFRAAWQRLDTDGQAALERGVDMNFSRVEAMERRAEAAERRAARMPVDNSLVVDLVRRANLPWGSEGKIYSMSDPDVLSKYGKGIDDEKWRFIEHIITADQTKGADSLKVIRNNTIGSFKAQFIKDSMGLPDQFGAERFNAFMQWAFDKEEEAKKAGKDPRTIYNESSPDYIGKNVNDFRPTVQQRQQKMLEDIRRGSSGAIQKPKSVIRFDKNGNPQ